MSWWLLALFVLVLLALPAHALPFSIETGGPGDGSNGMAVQGAVGAQGLEYTNGKLWIADSQRRKVKFIQGGGIWTYAGTGITGLTEIPNGTPAQHGSFSGPAKVTVDAATTDVYFTDNGRLYVITRGDELLHPIKPSGMSWVANVLAIPGKLLLIDSNKIYSCSLPYSGAAWCNAPTHVAGTGSTPFNGDGLAATATNMWPIDLAREPNGTLLVVDGGRLRRFMIGGSVSTVMFNLSQPKSVIAAQNGDIFVSETGGNLNRVSRLRAGVVTVILGSGGVVNVPQKWCMAPPCEGLEYPFAAVDLAYDDTTNTLYAVDTGAGVARINAGAIASTPTQTIFASTATPVPTNTAAPPTMTATRTWTPLPTCNRPCVD